MGGLKTYRNIKCPFYDFYYFAGEKGETPLLIPTYTGDYCGLRRFIHSIGNRCIMKDVLSGPFFEKCNIAKTVFKNPENKKRVQNLEVLTVSKEGKESPIVPFGIWLEHILDGVDLEELIEKYLN